MKKCTLAFIASLLAVFSFAGCNNKSTDSISNLQTSSENGASKSENIAEAPILEDGYPATRAGDYVRAALSYGEWGGMESLPKDAYESVIPGFDKSWANDYCFANTMISANLFKVYIIKPIDGCKDKVKQWLNDYLDHCRNTAAYYPQQQAQAAGAVIGETDDGYFYLICHEKGADIADHMTASIR